MTRFPLVIAVVLLPAGYASAQSGPDAGQCEQIKQAIATYGYVAARKHALANYGKEAVRAGEKCLTKRDRERG
jgi:hypothetical protein